MAGRATRVLVIGVGSIGERHTRCFLATGRAEVAICDAQAGRMAEVAERYNIQRTYSNLTTALRDDHDAAVVATPAHLHVEMACRLAEAGVHLLVEKPLGTSLDGIDRLRQLVARHDVTLAVAYVLRAHPALRRMKQLLEEGRFGRPLELVASVGQHFPTYRPAYREIYYAQRDTGGGAVQDSLTHTIDAAQWLVGPIDRLVADVAHQALQGVDVEDTAHVLARHGSVLASYSLNQYQSPNELTITVVCQEATLRFELHHHRLRRMDRPDEPWQDEWAGDLQRDDLFVSQAHAFLDAIGRREPPLCTLDEAVAALHCNLAILRSAETGRWIRLPLSGPGG